MLASETMKATEGKERSLANLCGVATEGSFKVGPRKDKHEYELNEKR